MPSVALGIQSTASRISFDLVKFPASNQISTLPHSPLIFSLGYLSTTLFVEPSLDQAHSFRTNKITLFLHEKKYGTPFSV